MPRRIAVGMLAFGVVSVSGLQIWGQLNSCLARYEHAVPYAGPEYAKWIHQSFHPFRTINAYGLFARMTTSRPEIIVQGSDDGVAWRDYTFPYKPGDLQRRPRQVAPFQPRIDWQMWFAALDDVGNPYTSYWFFPLLEALLEGSEDVLAHLETNPFPDQPPRYIRAVMYDYTFTDRTTRARTGAWWERTNERIFCPPYSLPPKP